MTVHYDRRLHGEPHPQKHKALILHLTCHSHPSVSVERGQTIANHSQAFLCHPANHMIPRCICHMFPQFHCTDRESCFKIRLNYLCRETGWRTAILCRLIADFNGPKQLVRKQKVALGEIHSEMRCNSVLIDSGLIHNRFIIVLYLCLYIKRMPDNHYR